MDKPKRKKAKTSTAVKSRWNKKHYDEVKVRFKKGVKEEIKRRSDSVNGYIVEAVYDRMERENKEEKKEERRRKKQEEKIMINIKGKSPASEAGLPDMEL